MPTSNSVGPKPKMIVCHNGVPSSSGLALTVTPLSIISVNSSSSPNDGRTVLNLVFSLASLSSGGYLTSFLKVPWISSPFDVTSLTLPDSICWRKYVYGTLSRVAGRDSSALIVKFRISSPTRIHQKLRRRGIMPSAPVGGLSGGLPSTRHGVGCW